MEKREVYAYLIPDYLQDGLKALEAEGTVSLKEIDYTNFAWLSQFFTDHDLFAFLEYQNDVSFSDFLLRTGMKSIATHPTNISWLASVENRHAAYRKLKEDERKVKIAKGLIDKNDDYHPLNQNYFLSHQVIHNGFSANIYSPLCRCCLGFSTIPKTATPKERSDIFASICQGYGYHQAVQMKLMDALLAS